MVDTSMFSLVPNALQNLANSITSTGDRFAANAKARADENLEREKMRWYQKQNTAMSLEQHFEMNPELQKDDNLRKIISMPDHAFKDATFTDENGKVVSVKRRYGERIVTLKQVGEMLRNLPNEVAQAKKAQQEWELRKGTLELQRKIAEGKTKSTIKTKPPSGAQASGIWNRRKNNVMNLGKAFGLEESGIEGEYTGFLTEKELHEMQMLGSKNFLNVKAVPAKFDREIETGPNKGKMQKVNGYKFIGLETTPEAEAYPSFGLGQESKFKSQVSPEGRPLVEYNDKQVTTLANTLAESETGQEDLIALSRRVTPKTLEKIRVAVLKRQEEIEKELKAIAEVQSEKSPLSFDQAFINEETETPPTGPSYQDVETPKAGTHPIPRWLREYRAK